MIFISYRRDGGSDLARSLSSELERRGYSVFLDVEDLRSGPFNTALLREIESCSDFILILTKGALDRCSHPADWVRQEVACALRANVNIVPVFAREFDWPQTDLPEEIAGIRERHGIHASHEYFTATIDRLVRMLRKKPNRIIRPVYAAGGVLLVALLALLAIYVAINREPSSTSSGSPPATTDGGAAEAEHTQHDKSAVAVDGADPIAIHREDTEDDAPEAEPAENMQHDESAVAAKGDPTATHLDAEILLALAKTYGMSVFVASSNPEWRFDATFSLTRLPLYVYDNRKQHGVPLSKSYALRMFSEYLLPAEGDPPELLARKTNLLNVAHRMKEVVVWVRTDIHSGLSVRFAVDDGFEHRYKGEIVPLPQGLAMTFCAKGFSDSVILSQIADTLAEEPAGLLMTNADVECAPQALRLFSLE